MAIQLSVAVRNARLDAIETTINTSPVLKIYTNAQPSNCAASDSETVLATLSLPADWMEAANAGAKALKGTWEDLTPDSAGVAGHFRIYDTGGTTCHMQGSCGVGTGDLQLNTTTLALLIPFSITALTLTDANS